MQYIVDDSGAKTSVIVPYSQWEKINADYDKLKKKFDVFLSIKEGIEEIKTSKNKGVKLQTLSDFLNESKR